jgi:hypothetical protein
LDCYNNRLPLSELYHISQTIWGWLDTQRLAPLEVTAGDTIDFSSQAVFGGIFTVFTVENAVEDINYTLNNGFLIFKDSGNYTLTMTNSAIAVYHKVIVEIKVHPDSTVGVNELQVTSYPLSVYPNPTSNQFTIKFPSFGGAGVVEIFDIFGRNLLSFSSLLSPETFPSFGGAGVVLDISHLANGIYFIKIQTNNGIITKKIIKQ